MNYSPSSRLASDIYPLIRRLKLPTVFQELLAGRGGRPITGLTSLLAWRCPVRGAASRPVKPQRRLSRTFARNGPPRCGCPIHASFVRSGPVSWDAYGRCSCGLSCVETLEPRFGPPCLSTGPSLDPLGYAICSALLARARRRLETLAEGALALQLGRAARRTSGNHPARSPPPSSLASLVERTVANVQDLPPCDRAAQGRSLRLFILRYRSLLSRYPTLLDKVNKVIRH